MRVPLDVVGDIAILKFSRLHPLIYKKFYAWRLLKLNSHIKVVLEKTGGFSGELRKQETRWIAGEKRKDTVHRENDCSFYLDVDETYFSPRLSQERKIVAEEIIKELVKPVHSTYNSLKEIKKDQSSKDHPAGRNNPQILIMFGGIAPQAIVLAKFLKKNKLFAKIISSELNKKACEFAEKNVFANKLSDYVEIVSGDSEKFCEKLAKKKEKFDFILMLRPNLEKTFLESALKVVRKGTIVYYHGFGEEEKVKKEVLEDVKKAKRKISNFSIRKAGDIGVNKWRWNVKFKVS